MMPIVSIPVMIFSILVSGDQVSLPNLEKHAAEQNVQRGKRPQIRLASRFDNGVQNDSGDQMMILAQATEDAGAQKKDQKKQDKKKDKAHLIENKDDLQLKLDAFRETRENVLIDTYSRWIDMNAPFMAFLKKELAEREKNENDSFVSHIDIAVPPSEVFAEKLLVVSHTQLCLGQSSDLKVSFHPCNENTGNLLWAAQERALDRNGNLVESTPGYDRNRVYAQIVHNGLCLTTPFYMEDYSEESKTAHKDKLSELVKHPNPFTNNDAQLVMNACTSEAKGQLWKITQLSHSDIHPMEHGFTIQERSSGFCLSADTAHANTSKPNSEVKAIFLPCIDQPHGIFVMTPPNKEMPVFYDHNGVIKSDNGFCLDVPNDPLAERNGSVVFLKACEDDAFDRWDYVVQYDQTVKITNDFTGYCLYPYDVKEGKIPGAETGQIVQRHCDARHGQDWKMRTLPKQMWYQLESLDKSKKPTGKCLIPEDSNPTGKTEVKVKLDTCKPTSSRWQFGHWKGKYAWTEWTVANSQGGENDLSTTYWVSKDDLVDLNAPASAQTKKADPKANYTIKNGVCRVILGQQSIGEGSLIYPGTWRGMNETCSYVTNNQTKIYYAVSHTGFDAVEVLSGLDIGQSDSTASWKNSAGGIPLDATGQNTHPPSPGFSPFLAGGDHNDSEFYLCRVKSSVDKHWRYGYQKKASGCLTDAGTSVTGPSEVLSFKTVKN